MRETLQQAAKKMLTEPVGTERALIINVDDGLTGVPPGASQRGLRTKNTTLRVDAKVRADGKKRRVVVSLPKGSLVIAGEWE